MTNRAFPFALTALMLVGGGVAWVECSKSATCGDMKVEGDEQCDKGPMNGVDGSGCASDCRFANIAVASIQVSYSKLLNEVPGYNGAVCNDLGIGGAHVVVTGPQPVDETWTGCMQSKQYANITPGMYQASITLLDEKMNPLTNAVMTAMTDVQKGPVTNLNINFHQSDFTKQDYTGFLDWTPGWGMADKKCSDASVTMEQLRLVDKNGKPVSMPGMTSDGIPVNGGFGTCFTPDTMTLFQRIGPLTWGHYTLSIVGKGTMGVSFCKAFEVFVPPGPAPQTYQLVVDPFDPSNADAGTCP